MPYLVSILLAAFLVFGFAPQGLPAQLKPIFLNYENHEDMTLLHSWGS